MKLHNSTIAIFVLVGALFFSISSVYADGMHVVSDAGIHLYEPSQKAVITWDGTKETMILSTAVKADDMANFAWIVPVRSSSKPTVTAGDISVFKQLAEYFGGAESDYYDNYSLGQGLKSAGEGVEVIETKKVDVYDVTILKANNSSDLMDW